MSLSEPTDPTDVSGRLNYACQLGHTSFVENVVRECGVKNFDLLDQYGSPPLYNACLKNDCPRVVQYLLDKGATVGLKNADNETALFIAVFNERIESVRVLIAAGAKVDEKGGVYGDYPLHICVKNNHPDMMALLMSYGASVNCRNDENETPLFLACKLDLRKRLAYELLMAKANKSLMSSDGKDCLYIASEKRNKDCVALLKASGPAELLQIKQTWDKQQPGSKKPKTMERKESWQDAAFRNELKELGITEEQAKRKPRALPQTAAHKKTYAPGMPQPLFESDEEIDDVADRLIAENRRASEAHALPLRYQDPEGTHFNPADSSHVRDTEKTKDALRNYHGPTATRVQPPKPGLVEAHVFADADVECESPPAKKVRSPLSKPLPVPKERVVKRHSLGGAPKLGTKRERDATGVKR